MYKTTKFMIASNNSETQYFQIGIKWSNFNRTLKEKAVN